MKKSVDHEQFSATTVAREFVQQYYYIMHKRPEIGHRFYKDISLFSRSDEDGYMSMSTTLQAIHKEIASLNYQDYKTEIKSITAQNSVQGGIHVLVTGLLIRTDNNITRNFTQTFFLARQDTGYFVQNDMFQYVDLKSVPVNVDMPPVKSAETVTAVEGGGDSSEDIWEDIAEEVKKDLLLVNANVPIVVEEEVSKSSCIIM